MSMLSDFAEMSVKSSSFFSSGRTANPETNKGTPTRVWSLAQFDKHHGKNQVKRKKMTLSCAPNVTVRLFIRHSWGEFVFAEATRRSAANENAIF